MTSRTRACLAVAPLLLLSIACSPRGVFADTVSVHGSERTRVDLTDRYVLHVPDRVLDMTVRIPIPDVSRTSRRERVLGVQSLGDMSVTSTLKPYESSEQRDTSGILYKVLVFHNPSPGDVTVQADFHRLSVSTELDGNPPSDRLPLVHVPEDLAVYLQPTHLVESGNPEIVGIARQIAEGTDSEYEVSMRMAHWIQANISYGGYTGAASNDAMSTLNNREALCEGWAQLFMALARANGIPARFVGGYTIGGTIQYPISPDGRSTMTVVTQPLPHAWVELWFPRVGWLPFDPQGSAGFVDSHHVPVWAGVDASAVLPLVSWHANTGERLSFAEEQSQGSVVDDISVQCASSQLGSGSEILLTL
jgi:transglutaminase-like putative cysteine protease